MNFFRHFPVILIGFGDAVYFSSPVGRCVETAQCIGEGRKLAGFGNFAIPGTTQGVATGASVNVTPLDALGDFFVRDVPAYEQTLRETPRSLKKSRNSKRKSPISS